MMRIDPLPLSIHDGDPLGLPLGQLDGPPLVGQQMETQMVCYSMDQTAVGLMDFCSLSRMGLATQLDTALVPLETNSPGSKKFE